MHVDRSMARSRVARVAPSDPPVAPERVAAVLKRGLVSSRMVFPDDGSVRMAEVWRTPELDGPRELEAVEGYLALVEDHLEPASRGELLSRVLALLSHFRSDPNPPEVETRIADDWAEDLGEFPMWAVDEAARRWRRTRRFRPQICEMLSLCEDAVRDARTVRDRLRSIVSASSRGPRGAFAAEARRLASAFTGRADPGA